MSCRVAVVEWIPVDGVAEAICEGLSELGHQSVRFPFDGAVPDGVDVVFSFAPYNRFQQIPRRVARIPAGRRPTFVHWNIENPPDLRIPWLLMGTVGACRSWVDRLNDSDNGRVRSLACRFPFSWINRRMHRFRHVGDYHYVHRKGWLDVFAETSQVYAQLHSRHGLPALFVPWGLPRNWHANLDLERDIDVLWMGNRRTRRRSLLLDRVRQELSQHGVEMYVADNVENPFIYGAVRTQFLNRAKITLNLLPRWYDHAFTFRFPVAAGNRSLVVSEPILPHLPMCEAGKHYVSAPTESLAETILYYLAHDDEKLQIVENAYCLVTTELTFGSSIQTILEAVGRVI